MTASLTRAESRLVLVVSAVQFVNILDFMMVMPLGPDFARDLGVPSSQIGTVGGSYTASACLVGLLAALFLDRFDRRQALAVAMGGLVISTALGGIAWDLPSLVGWRIVAGLFGGPATALAVAIVADGVAPERRGRAMGRVMGAFSIAAVIGVPLGLELGRIGGWRLPFFVVAGLGLLLVLLALAWLPPQRGHLDGSPPLSAGQQWARLRGMVGRPVSRLAFATAGLTLLQGFMIIPNIAAFVQFNLGFPRDRIGLLYLIGGALSFVGMRLTGRLVDRYGSGPVTVGVTALLTLVIWAGFVDDPLRLPILVLFPLFMLVTSARMVALGTAMSKVPDPAERAGFQSLVSSVQHLASAAGAFAASAILFSTSDGQLHNMPLVAGASIAIGLAVPLLMFRLERALKRQGAPRKAVPEAEPLQDF